MHIQKQPGLSSYRLFHRGEEIGHVDGRRIGFHGFATREDAAAAAWASSQEVELRRRVRRGAVSTGTTPVVVEQYPGGYVVAECRTLATLSQRDAEEAPGDPAPWGFEIEVSNDDGPEHVTLGLARVMWRGIRARRLQRRMGQFAPALTY